MTGPPPLKTAEASLDASFPKWLEKAEDLYDEALVWQEKGNLAKADGKLKAALKALAQAPKETSFLEIKDEIDSLFNKIEARLPQSADSEAVDQDQGLTVSPQELENAQAVQTPAVVESKKYAVPINPEDPLVKKYIAIYTGPRREEMERALSRMARYQDMILAELKAAKLPRELLYLPIVESEFQNHNVSGAGAMGLWQFMSQTGRGFDLKINYWIDERRDPEKATAAAVRYLKNLKDWFDDWHLALAGYNRGENGVQRDMESTRSPEFEQLAENKTLPSETQNYVPKFMACVLIADNAASYGFPVSASTPIQYDAVPLEKPLDLRIAAKCAGTTEETIRELNPALRVWCTPKNDPHFILKIPPGTKVTFQAALAQIKDWTPYTAPDTVRYRVRRGDVLGAIARRYHTSVKSIQRLNNINSPHRLRPGQVLIIRRSSDGKNVVE